eukprot:8232240-Pyramimonas_sp.AAC.1
MTWLFERVHKQEDIVIHECTALFEADWLFKAMAKTHHFVVMDISPCDFGFPSRRIRKWTLMAKKSRFAG